MLLLSLPTDSSSGAGRRKLGLKLSLIVLSLSVAGLAAVYQAVYPLSITAGTGFLLQTPPVLWILVVAALGALFFVATLTGSSLVTLGSVVGTALVLNFHYFLIYGVNGRDMRGEVSRLFFTLDRAHLGVDLYSYFQWPAHFLVVQQIGRVVSLPLVDTIWAGYLAYYVLFAVAVGVFAHSFTGGRRFPWVAGAVFYVVFTRQWLNNQLVPQFFALIVLLFLFSLHETEDTRFKALRAVLYLLLVLAHPFLFAFYVLYVLALPFVRAVIDTAESVGTDERPFAYQLFEVVRQPLRSARALRRTVRRRVGVPWLSYVVFLVGSYLSFLLLRFSLFKERILVLLGGPMTESSSEKIPVRVMELLFGTTRDFGGGTPGEAVETVLLYDLTPSLLKDVTLYGTVGVLLVLVLIAVVALLSKPSADIFPSGIAVVLSGVVYYLAGFSLPIIGTRAFQVLFLPFGTFLDGDRDHRRYVRIAVLVVLLVSPVVVANFMANYSLTAGGNTHDYHADEAGKFLLEYAVLDRDGAVTYPAAGYPPETTKAGEELPITTLEAMIVGGNNGSETIVYGQRQEYLATHFDHRCNFSPDRRNVIYDNRLRVLRDSSVSEPFACTER